MKPKCFTLTYLIIFNCFYLFTKSFFKKITIPKWIIIENKVLQIKIIFQNIKKIGWAHSKFLKETFILKKNIREHFLRVILKIIFWKYFQTYQTKL